MTRQKTKTTRAAAPPRAMSPAMRAMMILAWVVAAAVVIGLIAAHSYGDAAIAAVFLAFVLAWAYGRRRKSKRGGR